MLHLDSSQRFSKLMASFGFGIEVVRLDQVEESPGAFITADRILAMIYSILVEDAAHIVIVQKTVNAVRPSVLQSGSVDVEAE